MRLLKKYKQLENKANQYFGKYDSECSKMMELITPLLEFPMPFETQYVFKQAGDGYVLVTEGKDGAPKNTPVDAIINWFEKTGQLVDEDVLHTLSI